MKKIAALLICTVFLSACTDPELPEGAESQQPPALGTTSEVSEMTQQSADTTAAVHDGAYALLSQYLERKPETSVLKNCRMLGGGAYLLCFEQSDHSYEIEYTTLSHGKQIYTMSDGAAHSAADGFWVLSQASESTAAAMEWQDIRYQRLRVYQDSLSLEADVDVSPLGTIDAFAVDIDERDVYAARHTAEGLQIDRLGFFADTPETVCVIGASGENAYLQTIRSMHMGDGLLLVVGEASENGETVPCFGSISLRRGTVWLHTRKNGGAFEAAPYDGGAYFYDAEHPTGIIYRIGDARESELTLGYAAESMQVFSAQSGAYFATCMKISETAAEITVYDSEGGRITKSISHESAPIAARSEIRMYFDEDARRLLYCVADNDWRELLY